MSNTPDSIRKTTVVWVSKRFYTKNLRQNELYNTETSVLPNPMRNCRCKFMESRIQNKINRRVDILAKCIKNKKLTS